MIGYIIKEWYLKETSRTFIQTTPFIKEWNRLGLTEEDLRHLELEIMRNPEAYPVIVGTGGLRKMRFPIHNRGKSGSIRVCYVVFIIHETVYLITAYPKNEKENLSDFEKKSKKTMLKELVKSL